MIFFEYNRRNNQYLILRSFLMGSERDGERTRVCVYVSVRVNKKRIKHVQQVFIIH